MHGLAAADLASAPLAPLLSGGADRCTVRLADPGPTPGPELAAGVATAELRRLGVAVDRRSLLLQPRWRSDRQAIDLLSRRPLGPALVTLLELHGPLRAAAAHGLGTDAAQRAIAALADDLAAALAIVGRGGAAHLWLCALGAPVAVAHTLDVARLCRRLAGITAAAAVRVRATSSSAEIEVDSHRALATLRRRLPASALAGAIVEPTPRGLRLLAPPCTAFGRQRTFARRPHGDEVPAAAALPWPLRTDGALDLAGLGARVTMAAAALAVERRRARTAAPPTPAFADAPPAALPAADAPQLLPIDRDARADGPLPSLLAPLELETWDFSDVP